MKLKESERDSLTNELKSDDLYITNKESSRKQQIEIEQLIEEVKEI